MRPEIAHRGASWRQEKWILGGLLATLWGVFLVDWLGFHHSLVAYGIVPRTARGLVGIVCAPFLHADLGHIASNSLSLVILGWYVLERRVRDFALVSILGAVIGGLGIWLFARGGPVVGYSGVIFAYLGYLLGYGFFARRLRYVVGSIVMGIMFGAMLFGVLPGEEGISWEAHLFGLLTGILAARLLATR
jgi:membrane associated rhomboid family serine protease